MNRISGEVILYRNDTNEPLAQHQIARVNDLAGIIADMKGYAFTGLHQGNKQYGDATFIIPGKTILEAEGHALGIKTENDFLGGMVSAPYMLTKSVAHNLVHEDAEAPPCLESPLCSHHRGYRVARVYRVQRTRCTPRFGAAA